MVIFIDSEYKTDNKTSYYQVLVFSRSIRASLPGDAGAGGDAADAARAGAGPEAQGWGGRGLEKSENTRKKMCNITLTFGAPGPPQPRGCGIRLQRRGRHSGKLL